MKFQRSSCCYLLRACYFWQFGAKICLLTSFRDTCFIEINPKDQSPTRAQCPLLHALTDGCIPEVWLSFWSEVHYNSLYEADDYVFACQIFQHGYLKKSTGSFRGAAPLLFSCLRLISSSVSLPCRHF
ncbi:hypothetical protein GW17_00022803 [Ensete ventricosum]|nr:hypothetical protein GW17_00022803 [Ensete ventricosum]